MKDNLAWIISDVEDLLAARMELALLGSWSPWTEYVVQSDHRLSGEPRLGDTVKVRIKYAGQLKVELEVLSFTGYKNSEVHLYPEATEWFFAGLEDEAEARAVREPNDRPLRPY